MLLKKTSLQLHPVFQKQGAPEHRRLLFAVKDQSGLSGILFFPGLFHDGIDLEGKAKKDNNGCQGNSPETENLAGIKYIGIIRLPSNHQEKSNNYDRKTNDEQFVVFFTECKFRLNQFFFFLGHIQ
jgi:hypothetical protein